MYHADDYAAVSNFRCAPYGDKPATRAQGIIRTAPDRLSEFGASAYITVAYDSTGITGVIVFGMEAADSPAVTIYALGVLLERQRQGIGTYLKSVIMRLVANVEFWPHAVASTVHRQNYKMKGLNEKLGVTQEPDPTDGEWLLTAVRVEMP